MKKVFITLLIIIASQSSFAQSDSNYLPVRLSSFEAGVQKDMAKLHWSTVCYLQYANFEIQVSPDGENYQTIHSFTADKYRCSQPFDFIDSSQGFLGNVFYRINVGNIDGKFFSSEVRTVYLMEKSFDLISVYPTMVTSSLNFSLSNNKVEPFSAVIINGLGAVVKKQQFQGANGVAKFVLKANNLSSGYYWLRVSNGKGEVRTARFIKQ